MYSVVKIARRAKITLLFIKFPGASSKFEEISSISRSNFKFQEMSRSCVHPVLHTEWHSCHPVNASKPQRKPKEPTPPIKHHPVDFTDTACWSMLSRVYETERCPSVRLPRMNPLQQNSCWRFAAPSPGKRY